MHSLYYKQLNLLSTFIYLNHSFFFYPCVTGLPGSILFKCLSFFKLLYFEQNDRYSSFCSGDMDVCVWSDAELGSLSIIVHVNRRNVFFGRTVHGCIILNFERNLVGNGVVCL